MVHLERLNIVNQIVLSNKKNNLNILYVADRNENGHGWFSCQVHFKSIEIVKTAAEHTNVLFFYLKTLYCKFLKSMILCPGTRYASLVIDPICAHQ